ncbi:membrane protein [Salmonella enterica subsp. diarizonae]|nr:membrane protein [Salmonella enterica subsp. diarizonae]
MERNVTLDFVRGVAILGILLLNISAFGLPKAAYLNPAWYGSIIAEDAWSWAILDIVAQAKFLRYSRCCLARGYKCCFRVVHSGFSRA